MGKAEAGTPKALANAIKAKGELTTFDIAFWDRKLIH